jgi:putative peptidoglycan lipid II flippase
MVPATLGVAAFQINVLLTDGVAFLVDPQIVASFDYAVRLMELPQGVFGISLATYLLATLSGLAAEKKTDAFCGELRSGLHHLLLVNLLASVLLAVLAEPIVRLLFERREFTAAATERAALALACLAPGLAAFSMVNILARAFYALGDTHTPMRISLACLGINLGLAVLLVAPYGQGGLGVANSLSAVVNMTLLLRALRGKLPAWRFDVAASGLPVLGLATTLAGVTAWLIHGLWEGRMGHAGLGSKLGAVFLPACAAALAYGLVTLLAGVPSAREITGLLRQRLRRRR